jgi:ABC-type lipoprotein export system ATPase subunit
MDLIEQLNRDYNQTFVIVTHDERISSGSDRVIQMDSGLIVSSKEKVMEK